MNIMTFDLISSCEIGELKKFIHLNKLIDYVIVNTQK